MAFVCSHNLCNKPFPPRKIMRQGLGGLAYLHIVRKNWTKTAVRLLAFGGKNEYLVMPWSIAVHNTALNIA